MENQTKHDRRVRRKKIRQQMEFYFSDANLNKDNFMRQIIASSYDGYIKLTEFLKFNKVRNMTQDAQCLAKALKKSKELEINEDQTAVRRLAPVKEIENVDDRTVYVEFLPIDATLEWLTQVFSVCGRVAYVSLPRYPTSGQIKQFAFIEYHTPEEAQLSCEKLNNPPIDAPEKVGKFPVWNKALYSLSQRVQARAADESHADDNSENLRKRQLPDTEADERSKKKRKTEGDSSGESDSGEDSSNAEQCETDRELPRLRVIPKTEWLELKSQYIQLQKSNMVKLKKSLNLANKDNCHTTQKRNNNSKEEETETTEQKVHKKSTGPEFVANVIVKIESPALLTKQQIRDEFGPKCNIAYVEVLDGENACYVRCKDSVSAEMITNGGKDGHTYTLLQSEEELGYWKKLSNDRTVKFTKNEHIKKKSKTKKQNKKIVFD